MHPINAKAVCAPLPPWSTYLSAICCFAFSPVMLDNSRTAIIVIILKVFIDCKVTHFLSFPQYIRLINFEVSKLTAS